MTHLYLARGRHGRTAAITVVMLFALLPVRRALADGPLGLYVGAGIGQARVEADPAGLTGVSIPSLNNFREDHSAYKAIVGVRPLSLFAAELSYIDLGHPRVTGLPALTSADVSISGLTVFGMLFLPVPVVDIYLKAGLARLDGRIKVTTCGVDLCQSAHASPTNTGLAGGAGVQLKLGGWAARGEYERFNVAGGNSGVFSVGVTWSLL